MSMRASISFADDEKELYDYYNENGKSDLVKRALEFYRENKDRVITDSVIKILKEIGVGSVIATRPDAAQKPGLQDKLTKIKR